MDRQAAIVRAITEPYALALLQWPALLGALALDGAQGWRLAARIALAVWFVAMVLGGYSRGRGIGFGNAMALSSACIGGAWWGHPSPWAWAFVVAVLLLLVAAQRLRLRSV